MVDAVLDKRGEDSTELLDMVIVGSRPPPRSSTPGGQRSVGTKLLSCSDYLCLDSDCRHCYTDRPGSRTRRLGR